MNLKKFLGIQSTQEKVEDYRKLKGQLANLETLGQELSDKFSIQKSVIDGVDVYLRRRNPKYLKSTEDS